MNESNDVSSIKARILALVTDNQRPFAEFELRMWSATLEAEHLADIHRYWRPIAVERDLLAAKLEGASSAPATPGELAESRQSRRGRAEMIQAQYEVVLKQHTDLQERFDALREQHDLLQKQHAALQRDCDDLLADNRPRRTS